jgi:chromate reductase
MHILALSGSLRAASINSALLRACARLAEPEMQVRVSDCLGHLPLFNPDLDPAQQTAVCTLYAEVQAADALLIASPEYAHGISGAMKNALDWLVSFEPFVAKPVAVFNASPRAHIADAALREVLKTMSAVIVEAASTSIPLLGAHLSEDAMVADPVVSHSIRQALAALQHALQSSAEIQDSAFPLD